jgi:hypothetical protein
VDGTPFPRLRWAAVTSDVDLKPDGTEGTGTKDPPRADEGEAIAANSPSSFPINQPTAPLSLDSGVRVSQPVATLVLRRVAVLWALLLGAIYAVALWIIYKAL